MSNTFDSAAIQEVVSRVGETFGFQKENKNYSGDPDKEDPTVPKKTPATIKLVSDHIERLLSNEYARIVEAGLQKEPDTDHDAAPQPEEQLVGSVLAALSHRNLSGRQQMTYPQRAQDWVFTQGHLPYFSQAVWRLHALLFQPYNQWLLHLYNTRHMAARDDWSLPTVRPGYLHKRPLDHAAELNKLMDPQQEPTRTTHRNHSLAAKLGLAEIALYFLIWTEAANVRLLPEGMWFLYWAMRHSSQFRFCWRVLDGTPFSERELHQMNELSKDVEGSFMDFVITPIFQYMSFQMIQLGHKRKEEISVRLGYDDFNECFVRADVVYPAIRWLRAQEACLKVHERQLVKKEPRDADLLFLTVFDALKKLHYLQTRQVPPAPRSGLRMPPCIQEAGSIELMGVAAADSPVLAANGGHLPPGPTGAALKGTSIQDALSRPSSDLGPSDTPTSTDNSSSTAPTSASLPDESHLPDLRNTPSRIECVVGSKAHGRLLTGEAEPYAGFNEGDFAKHAKECEAAATWWHEHFFKKTFIETRSLWMPFRAFFRVFAFHILFFQFLLILAFTDNSWNWHQLSSLVVTHAWMLFLDHLMGAILSISPQRMAETMTRSAPNRKLLPDRLRGVEDEDRPLIPDMKLWEETLPNAFHRGTAVQQSGKPGSSRRGRKLKLAVDQPEGISALSFVPLFLLSFVLAAGCTVLFALQWYEGDSDRRDTIRDIWLIVSIVYTGANVAVFIVQTRNGYIMPLWISVARSLGLLRIRCFARSALADSANFVYRPMTLPWTVVASNIAFWACVLVLKGVVEYVLFIEPLVEPLKALDQRGLWGTDNGTIDDTGVHYPDADFILQIIRVVPVLLISLVATLVWYQATLSVWGGMRALLLSLGTIRSWKGVQLEFPVAISRWYLHCMSDQARRRLKNATSFRFGGATAAAPLDPILEEEEEEEEEEESEEDDMDLYLESQGTRRSDDARADRFPRATTTLHRNRATRHRVEQYVPLKDDDHETFAAVFAFSKVWRKLLEDLRNRDLLSNSQLAYLSFPEVKVPEKNGFTPLLPPFVCSGVLRAYIDETRTTDYAPIILKRLLTLLLQALQQLTLLQQGEVNMLDKISLLERRIKTLSGGREQLVKAMSGLIKSCLKVLDIQKSLRDHQTQPSDQDVKNQRQALRKNIHTVLRVLKREGEEYMHRLSGLAQSFGIPESTLKAVVMTQLNPNESHSAAVGEDERLTWENESGRASERGEGNANRRSGVFVSLRRSWYRFLVEQWHQVPSLVDLQNRSEALPSTRDEVKARLRKRFQDVACWYGAVLRLHQRLLPELMEDDYIVDPDTNAATSRPKASMLRMFSTLLKARNQDAGAGPSNARPGASAVGEGIADGVPRPLDRWLMDMSRWAVVSGSDNANMKELLGLITQIVEEQNPGARLPDPNDEASQAIFFFMQSLFSPHLAPVPPVRMMRSWSVLTPHYGEDVLYALDAEDVRKRMGTKDRNLVDLITKQTVKPGAGTDGGELQADIIAALRSFYPQQWLNFVERWQEKLLCIWGKDLKLGDVTEVHFVDLPLEAVAMPDQELGEKEAAQAVLQQELMLWASNRGQLLARTVRGMMCYQQAIELLHNLDANIGEVHGRQLSQATGSVELPGGGFGRSEPRESAFGTAEPPQEMMRKTVLLEEEEEEDEDEEEGGQRHARLVARPQPAVSGVDGTESIELPGDFRGADRFNFPAGRLNTSSGGTSDANASDPRASPFNSSGLFGRGPGPIGEGVEDSISDAGMGTGPPPFPDVVRTYTGGSQDEGQLYRGISTGSRIGAPMAARLAAWMDQSMSGHHAFDVGPLGGLRPRAASYHSKITGSSKGLLTADTPGNQISAPENDSVLDQKFQFIVASQIYAHMRDSGKTADRWLAYGIELLLDRNPRMRVAFIDRPSEKKWNIPDRRFLQYSVLIRAPQRSPEARMGEAGEAGEEQDVRKMQAAGQQRPEEEYRVRLPWQEWVPGRSIVLGEGKPENQNHATIFCFGESLQTIDMNQDGYLAEALKVRNLLEEFGNPWTSDGAQRSRKGPLARAGSCLQSLLCCGGKCNTELPGEAEDDVKMVVENFARRAEEKHDTVLVGFRENIFSSKVGAIASFAAASELVFGTIVQRSMQWPGGVRFHYGHPDVWNKMWTMTRGGVSKATPGLHISEDVFGGYQHTLRGGKTQFREYISVGKGRDMGFDTINKFEAKIAGGNAEQVISRDVYRLAHRMDFFRLMSFYHSGPGFFISITVLMLSVYLNIWTLIILSLADATEYSQTATGDFIIGSDQIGRVEDLNRLGISVVDVTVNDVALDYTPFLYDNSTRSFVGRSDYTDPLLGLEGAAIVDDAETLQVSVSGGGEVTYGAAFIIQVGMMSILPYVSELWIEQGLIRMVVTVLKQIVAGALVFFIFKQQTTATAFTTDMLYGSAGYIATGRGLALTRKSFTQVYSNYSRSHMYFGMELIWLMIVFALVNRGYSFGLVTWGTWLVALSLIVGPFWFNPFAFDLQSVMADKSVWVWLNGGSDPETKKTWKEWHREQLASMRSEGKRVVGFWRPALFTIVRTLLSGVIAVFVVGRLDAPEDWSKYGLFFVFSGVMWGLVILLTLISARFTSRGLGRYLTTLGMLGALLILAGIIVSIIVANGAKNVVLMLYTNIELLASAMRLAIVFLPREPRLQQFIDKLYLLADTLFVLLLHAFLYPLAWIWVVHWIQTHLLFNAQFVHDLNAYRTYNPLKPYVQETATQVASSLFKSTSYGPEPQQQPQQQPGAGRS